MNTDKSKTGSFFSSSVFIGAVSVACFLFLLTTQLCAQTTRPNVLFIIADDMSFAHTSFAGDPVVKTPNFDRIAREGVFFTNAHTIAASCTPSRASILTGRPIWQLEHGSVLHGTLPAKFAVYPDLLEDAGYRVGLTGKGWGPGDHRPGGRQRNPAGPAIEFDKLLSEVPKERPFCFWYGSGNPHRAYEQGSGIASGMDPTKVKVPPMLPDVPDVRRDICDYLLEIQKFDAEVGRLLASLEKAGRLDETLIIVTSDNGMPFPRGKATLYAMGTRMPLAIRYPAKITGGRVIDDLVSHIDIMPTILGAAGVAVPKEVVGISLMSLLTGEAHTSYPPRDRVFLGNERHAECRAGGVGYPRRVIRTRDHLYIRNFEPDRWPAGDPPIFGDVDPASSMRGGSLSKDFILQHRDDPQYKHFYEAAFAKKPAEELYDLKADPAEMTNVADDPKYAETKALLRAQLDEHLKQTGDPRAIDPAIAGQTFDAYPTYRGQPRPAATRPAATRPAATIDFNTPVDPALQARLEAIDELLRDKFEMTTAQTAVGLFDLKTQRLAMIHPDRIEYAASVPKVGILLAYFTLHPEAGKNLDPQTRHELGLMAKASSNEMAAKFSREMSLAKVQEAINSFGLYDKEHGGGIWVGKHYGKGDERYVDPVGGHSHGATVRQLLRFWLMLEQGQLVSRPASRQMREIFASPDIPHDDIKFVKALKGRDVQILRKWGSWQDWRHDSAIISGPDRKYILVGLTRHAKGDAYLEALAQEVDDLRK